MKRYGDNVNYEGMYEQPVQKGEPTLVLRLGCSACYGSIPGPVTDVRKDAKPQRNSMFVKLLSVLGLKQIKEVKE